MNTSARKRRLVTAAPDLPLVLVDPNSQILKHIDALDWPIANGKTAKPALLKAIKDVRAECKSACNNYTPIPVANMPATNGSHLFPVLVDGRGLLCASGTEGHRFFRGDLCKKVCVVADTTRDKKERSAQAPSDVYIEFIEWLNAGPAPTFSVLEHRDASIWSA